MIYISATDHINKHPYQVTVPPYIFSIHKPILSGDLFAPMYESFDSNMAQRAMITISKMVELNISSTSFTIIDDYDVLLILHQIDAYVGEVYPLMSDKAVAAYLERILKLRVRIYTIFRRVLNRRPQWKLAYSHGDNIFGIIAKLYRSIGISMDAPLAPFEELAMCPTVRANLEQFERRLMPTTSAPSSTGIEYRV